VQKTLKETKIDDDCPTDGEQLKTAINHVKGQLRKALDVENVVKATNSTSTSSYHEKMSSFTFNSRSSSEGGNTEELVSEMSEFNDSGSEEGQKVARRLDFGLEVYQGDEESCEFDCLSPSLFKE